MYNVGLRVRIYAPVKIQMAKLRTDAGWFPAIPIGSFPAERGNKSKYFEMSTLRLVVTIAGQSRLCGERAPRILYVGCGAGSRGGGGRGFVGV